MFKNVYFDKFKGKIHLWEQIKGENFYQVIDWMPYVWLMTKTGSNFSDIYGNKVIRKTFSKYSKYKEFNESSKRNIACESNIKPEIQFLVDHFYQISDDDIEVPDTIVYFIDIEVHRDVGFPDVDDAEDEIVSISIYEYSKNHSNIRKIVTFGKNPTKKLKMTNKIVYYHCVKEEVLLEKFFNYIRTNHPDVISGWNICGFDLPYIINRSKRLWPDEEKYKLMSPVNNVYMWHSQDGNFNVEIAGTSVIDYMYLYKYMEKFRSAKVERYSLEYVSQYELHEGKVDHGMKLSELYYKNWDLYVQYNRKDVALLGKLEDKLGYIDMIQALSLITKCPMTFYDKQTSLIEGSMLTYLRRNNKVAPPFKGGNSETFEAAYVKDPRKGLHKWVVDLDVTSQYPTMVIDLNMSVETYLGKILDMNEFEIIEYTRSKSFPKDTVVEYRNGERKKSRGKIINKLLKNGEISIAPNGATFITSKPGVMVDVERYLFSKRVTFKNNFKTEKKKNPKSPTVKMWDNKQKAVKTILNSMYGATAVPYSRYFNINISQAITSAARHTIKSGERFLNEILNNPYLEPGFAELFSIKDEEIIKGDTKDYCIYVDTDSMFFSIEEFVVD
ncbi:MAG: DNA polymerase domain-containing protein, partial [Atribacterota bacterium]